MSLIISKIESDKKLDLKVEAWKILGNDRNEFIYISLKPGEEIELHANPRDVVFFVLEGKGIILVEDEKTGAEKNDCIEVKKNLQRGWRNESDDELRLLVIKSL